MNEHSGMETAIRITNYIKTGTNAHPVSFIWKTGFLETIAQNLEDLRGTKLFQKLLTKIVKLAGNKLGIEIPSLIGSRGVGTLTEAEVMAELFKPFPFDEYVVDDSKRSATEVTANTNDFVLTNELEAELEEEIDSDAEFKAALIAAENSKIAISADDAARGLPGLATVIKLVAAIIFRVIKRHIARRDHGFYPTVIEELARELYLADFGAWLWDDMKVKAEAMCQEDLPGTTGLDLKAVNYMLKQLKKYCDAHPETTIDLVGHSAGSIVICHLVKQPVTVKLTAFTASGLRGEIYTLNYKKEAFREPVSVSGTTAGLQCKYFKKYFLNTGGMKTVRPDSQFMATNIVVPPSVSAPSFGLQYSGYIDIPETGIYSFYLLCDDGGTVKVGGKLVVDNDGHHAPLEKSGQVALKKGLHPFNLNFIEGGGGFILKLKYSMGNGPVMDVPDSFFKH